MKVLNLTNETSSDIKFEVSKFPDGQQQVKIPLRRTFYNSGTSRMEGYEYQDWNVENKNIVQIKSRLNNFKDLELIICATKSLRELGIKEIHLYTPYFLGSRSDRKFEEGSNNYLKDVICPIINSLNFESITVLDPHSDVLEACLNNFKKVDNTKLVDHTISELYGDENTIWDEFILISPDAGANKKIFKVAEQIGYKGDIITCSKSRDENGKLSRVEVPYKDQNKISKDYIIIDDICDGGATFINIAKAIISNKFVKPKIYLIVTHGVFSRGTQELCKYFDKIYCTNSYSDYSLEDPYFVKQLNIF